MRGVVLNNWRKRRTNLDCGTQPFHWNTTPIIFCTVVVGIAGMEDMKKVGKTGGLALLYFEVVSTLALIVGLVIDNLVGNGVATIVVAKWTGELNTERLQAGLNNETWMEADAPEILLDQQVAHKAVTKG